MRNAQMAVQPACPQRVFGIVFLGVFLLMVSGCVTVPDRKSFPVSPETVSKIVSAVQAREAKISTLKGLFQAEIDGNGMAFTQSLQGTILYQRPDQFRIKGFTRFGGVVFDFVLSHGVYALRVKDQSAPLVGGMDNFQGLGDLRLPVLLSLRAIEVVLGKVPLTSSDRIVAAQQGEETYHFDIPPNPRADEPALSQRIVLDQDSLHVRRFDYVNSDGKLVVSIRTSDFRRVRDGLSGVAGATQMPFGVEAEDHVEGGRVVLEFLEISVNAPLDKRLFTLAAFE